MIRFEHTIALDRPSDRVFTFLNDSPPTSRPTRSPFPRFQANGRHATVAWN